MKDDPRATFGRRAVHLDAEATLVRGDAFALLAELPASSIHAIVTDPPYGVVEYEARDHDKLRSGRGGVWRIPPSFDGRARTPLPRFTVLTARERALLAVYFEALGGALARVLVPGGHVIMASTPLLSTDAFAPMMRAGLEKRGEIVRLVTTLRGGDRPKGAEREFAGTVAMPRASFEPWGLFRKPLAEKTLAANLRRFGAGALRRTEDDEPFKDVIACGPARGVEREATSHPSQKPQLLLRALVRAALPLGLGVVVDPFAGSGATLAAASHVGHASLGFERDARYVAMAKRAFVTLRDLPDRPREAPADRTPRPRRSRPSSA